MDERKQKYERMIVRFLKNISALGRADRRLGKMEREIGKAKGYISRTIREPQHLSLFNAFVLADMLDKDFMDLCANDYTSEDAKRRIRELESELEEAKQKLAELTSQEA